MSRYGMVLTPEAADDALDFLREYGSGNCSCHISPPCSSCLHPGNPSNQDEDSECWEPEDFALRINSRLDRVRHDLHLKIDRMAAGYLVAKVQP